MEKTFSIGSDELNSYVERVFQPDDVILQEIRDRAARFDLPDIHVGKMDGRHLEVISRAMSPRKIVEIGTLAGYSGVCLARGLQAGGMLYTFEFSAKHAEVARVSFEKAGFALRRPANKRPAPLPP